jgi:hypothetical protein
MKPWEQQDDRNFAMFSSYEHQQFQGLGIERIDPGKDQIDVASLDEANGRPIRGGFFDDVAQRF